MLNFIKFFWLGEEDCKTIRDLSGAITHSCLITSY